MENSSRKRLNDILHHLAEIDYVHPEDIPNIDLYMDQVLTFLAQELGTVREVNEDKAITKTMINNYTKNQLMPPPEKKKYSRDHMLNLIFIYYFKNFLGLKDIKSILDPINEKYYGDSEGLDFFDIYCNMIGLERKVTKEVTKDIIKKYNMSREAFVDQDEESKDVLQDFTFICLLSFDVFVKKMMIEQYISKRREDEGKEEKQDNQDNNEKPKEK
jgi:DNA-binding transcriptional MerR regulator